MERRLSDYIKGNQFVLFTNRLEAGSGEKNQLFFRAFPFSQTSIHNIFLGNRLSSLVNP